MSVEESNAMKAVKIGLLALAVLALGSCAFFFSFFGGPQVTITAPKTVVASGEIVKLTAGVTGASGLVSYKWYEDGVDLGVTSSTYSYSKFVTSSQDVTLTVEVTDGDGRTASDTYLVTVTRATTYSTITVINNSPTWDVYWLYVSPASSGDWGPDQLRPSYKIYASGDSFDLAGVPSGNWDLRAVSIYGTHRWTITNQTVIAPTPYSWPLDEADWDY
jgi:hypothetical protein